MASSRHKAKDADVGLAEQPFRAIGSAAPSVVEAGGVSSTKHMLRPASDSLAMQVVRGQASPDVAGHWKRKADGSMIQ